MSKTTNAAPRTIEPTTADDHISAHRRQCASAYATLIDPAIRKPMNAYKLAGTAITIPIHAYGLSRSFMRFSEVTLAVIARRRRILLRALLLALVQDIVRPALTLLPRCHTPFVGPQTVAVYQRRIDRLLVNITDPEVLILQHRFERRIPTFGRRTKANAKPYSAAHARKMSRISASVVTSPAPLNVFSST
ncbi:MAG: hypothetical protein QOI58_2934 [Thermoanaerobaculia bacterium]|jgi:hypothetical protein|nr:hypothetical protein [Thermoanaerobaculia bacterium]